MGRTKKGTLKRTQHICIAVTPQEFAIIHQVSEALDTSPSELLRNLGKEKYNYLLKNAIVGITVLDNLSSEVGNEQ